MISIYIKLTLNINYFLPSPKILQIFHASPSTLFTIEFNIIRQRLPSSSYCDWMWFTYLRHLTIYFLLSSRSNPRNFNYNFSHSAFKAFACVAYRLWVENMWMNSRGSLITWLKCILPWRFEDFGSFFIKRLQRKIFLCFRMRKMRKLSEIFDFFIELFFKKIVLNP